MKTSSNWQQQKGEWTLEKVFIGREEKSIQANLKCKKSSLTNVLFTLLILIRGTLIAPFLNFK